ncbi:MAG: hypothetical protein FJX76_22060 [Armatimonadetes bacterium]|nr:hypothetical protein [Armatimonadota bacterium]
MRWRKNTYVNLTRISAIRHPGRKCVVVLDDGTQFPVPSSGMRNLAAALRLETLHTLPGYTEPHMQMTRLGLRDWPFEIAAADSATLRAQFWENRQRLLANLIWQTVRLGQNGRRPDYGRNHRGFYYAPVLPTIMRAGFLGRFSVADLTTLALAAPMGGVPTWSTTAGELFRAFEELVGAMVGDYALFDYTDLGFVDPRSDLRTIGPRRPDVVLLAEKTSVDFLVREVAAHYGISSLILGGQPALVVTECFVRALLEVHRGDVTVVAYVDYDYSGDIVARAFCKQLARYGVAVSRLGFLVRPERFTREELRAWAHVIAPRRVSDRGKLRAWLKAGGGIDGRAYGIGSDHFRGIDRLCAAFEEEVGEAIIDASSRGRAAIRRAGGPHPQQD